MNFKTVASPTQDQFEDSQGLTVKEKALIGGVVGTAIRWLLIPLQQATNSAIAVENATPAERVGILAKNLSTRHYTTNLRVWGPWLGTYGGAGLAKYFVEFSLLPVVGGTIARAVSIAAGAVVDGIFSALNELQLESRRLLDKAKTPQEEALARQLTREVRVFFRAATICTVRGIPTIAATFGTAGLPWSSKLFANGISQIPAAITNADHVRCMQRAGTGFTVRPLYQRLAIFFRNQPARTTAVAILPRFAPFAAGFGIATAIDYMNSTTNEPNGWVPTFRAFIIRASSEGHITQKEIA